ncbi:hypothetical protein QT342_12115 [Escherichia coli]|uniref:hypothetical protein n=1 Tax=Escherichia coli TaxID=562 RepID=UPI00259CA3C5|nr:hypothetical protein [Escherichia coli]MDM4887225.1 hypothetical protein [Escherichia coli]
MLVEAIIVEVQDGNGLNLGVQWANKNVGAQQFTIPDYRFLTLRKVWLIIKRMVGSPARLRDMFSAYNGMAAGFFNGDWGVLYRAGQYNKNDISPPQAS